MGSCGLRAGSAPGPVALTQRTGRREMPASNRSGSVASGFRRLIEREDSSAPGRRNRLRRGAGASRSMPRALRSLVLRELAHDPSAATHASRAAWRAKREASLRHRRAKVECARDQARACVPVSVRLIAGLRGTQPLQLRRTMGRQHDKGHARRLRLENGRIVSWRSAVPDERTSAAGRRERLRHAQRQEGGAAPSSMYPLVGATIRCGSAAGKTAHRRSWTAGSNANRGLSPRFARPISQARRRRLPEERAVARGSATVIELLLPLKLRFADWFDPRFALRLASRFALHLAQHGPKPRRLRRRMPRARFSASARFRRIRSAARLPVDDAASGVHIADLAVEHAGTQRHAELAVSRGIHIAASAGEEAAILEVSIWRMSIFASPTGVPETAGSGCANRPSSTTGPHLQAVLRGLDFIRCWMRVNGMMVGCFGTSTA